MRSVPCCHLRCCTIIAMAILVTPVVADEVAWTKVHAIEDLSYIELISSDAGDGRHNLHVDLSKRPEKALFAIDIRQAHQEWCNSGKPPEVFPVQQNYKQVKWHCVEKIAGEMKSLPSDKDGRVRGRFTPSKTPRQSISIAAVVLAKPPVGAEAKDDEDDSQELAQAKRTQIRWWNDLPGGGTQAGNHLTTFMMGVRCGPVTDDSKAKYLWEDGGGTFKKIKIEVPGNECKYYSLRSGGDTAMDDKEWEPIFKKYPAPSNMFPASKDAIYKWLVIAGGRSESDGGLAYEVGQAIRGFASYVPDITLEGVDEVQVLAGAQESGNGTTGTQATLLVTGARVIAMAMKSTEGGIIAIIAGALMSGGSAVPNPAYAEAYFSAVCGFTDFLDDSVKAEAKWVVKIEHASGDDAPPSKKIGKRQANPKKVALIHKPGSFVQGIAGYESLIEGIAGPAGYTVGRGCWHAKVVVDGKSWQQHIGDETEVVVTYDIVDTPTYVYEKEKKAK